MQECFECRMENYVHMSLLIDKQHSFIVVEWSYFCCRHGWGTSRLHTLRSPGSLHSLTLRTICSNTKSAFTTVMPSCSVCKTVCVSASGKALTLLSDSLEWSQVVYTRLSIYSRKGHSILMPVYLQVYFGCCFVWSFCEYMLTGPNCLSYKDASLNIRAKQLAYMNTPLLH